jgi:hypothetical protein
VNNTGGIDGAFRSAVEDLIGARLTSFERIGRPERVDIFLLKDGQGRTLIAKRFHSPSLFWLELRALLELQGTGRVCSVIATSLQAGAPPDSGPFIVKPFLQDLKTAGADPIVRLERATQLVDASRRFFDAGWRDLDGRASNDGLDPNGRVIRFDLDSALSESQISRKLEPLLTGPETTELHRSLTTSLDGMFDEKLEARSVCMRIARLLMRFDERSWPLLDAVIRGGSLDRWVEAWQAELASPSAMGHIELSLPEARAMALVCFRILSQKDHGFTLSDLYHCSRGILTSAARRVLGVQDSAKSRRLMGLMPTMPEIADFRSEPADVPLTRPLNERRYRVTTIVGGSACRAIQKGTDWRCQDLVMHSLPAERPWILLADGASMANGFEAIVAVRDWWSALRNDNRRESDPRYFLLEQVGALHAKLVAIGTSLGRPCETALLIAYISEMADGMPVMRIASWGNVGFFLAHGTDNEESILFWGHGRVAAMPIGSSKVDPTSLDKSLIETTLTAYGRYRLRAFSDGAFGGDRMAYQTMFGIRGDITGIAAAAATWPETYSQIGGDDWSIAGMDILAESISAPVQVVERPLAHDRSRRGEIKLRSQARVELSEPVRAFWTNLADSDRELDTLVRRAFPDCLPTDRGNDKNGLMSSVTSEAATVGPFSIERREGHVAVVRYPLHGQPMEMGGRQTLSRFKPATLEGLLAKRYGSLDDASQAMLSALRWPDRLRAEYRQLPRRHRVVIIILLMFAALLGGVAGFLITREPRDVSPAKEAVSRL